ncbi:MAG: Holliday junction branch migration DNA helicase RuvB [Deltaproteobacteria bacterium]|nr:Holliday junction branch migration DNA helicase RuvB [Deltaproteobacteria bacterium]
MKDRTDLGKVPLGREEEGQDRALRPKRFDDYIGQEKLKANLKVFVAAARKRGEPLDHILFYGPPGLGKTTLAHILAAEMEVDIQCTSGPVIEKKGDLAGMLTSLQDGDILFIDEIHRLQPTVEESLYPAMEDFRFDVLIGEGPHARSIPLNLNRFTLVGATTRTGLLTSPLRNRFGVTSRLEYYSLDELDSIIHRSAGLLGIPVASEGAREIARRSRGTPRVANRLLRRVRDFAQVQGDGRVDVGIAMHALDSLEVDREGLDPTDRLYLNTLIRKFGGGPTGIETLAAALSEERDTLEDVCEPYLLQQGFIERTPRGRVATPLAHEHLGLKQKSPKEKGKLF